MPGEPPMDLQTAAAELNVHYQTVYRWVRTARLPATLVDGRYLVERDDLVLFEQERRRAAPPTPPSDARVERQAAIVLAALFDGDESAVRRSCTALCDSGLDAIALIERVISPALREIGRAWHDGEIDIWVEHRASAIVERALGDVVPNPRGRRRGIVVVAAVTGDRHALPTTMATVALRATNWNVHHLGADTPPASIHAFLRDHAVDLVVLSNTNPDAAASTERTADEVRAGRVPVLVGRPGAALTDLVADAASATGGSPPSLAV